MQTRPDRPEAKRVALGSLRCVLLLVLAALGLPACEGSGSTWEQDLAAAREAAQHRQYTEAERLFAAAALKAERFGREDPRVALSLTNLAQLYHSQGRYVDAEPLYHRALTIYEKAHGSQHADVAATLNNLGVLHRMHGQFAEAEPLLQRALTIKEKVLGRMHPDVAVTLSNLGTLYYTQGRYAQAEPLYHRALTIREQALGAEHPDVAKSLKDYALLLLKTNRGPEASRLVARAKAIQAKNAREDLEDKPSDGTVSTAK